MGRRFLTSGRRGLCLCLVAGLLFGGCSGDDDDDAESATTTTASEETPQDADAALAEFGKAVDTASVDWAGKAIEMFFARLIPPAAVDTKSFNVTSGLPASICEDLKPFLGDGDDSSASAAVSLAKRTVFDEGLSAFLMRLLGTEPTERDRVLTELKLEVADPSGAMVGGLEALKALSLVDSAGTSLVPATPVKESAEYAKLKDDVLGQAGLSAALLTLTAGIDDEIDKCAEGSSQ